MDRLWPSGTVMPGSSGIDTTPVEVGVSWVMYESHSDRPWKDTQSPELGDGFMWVLTSRLVITNAFPAGAVTSGTHPLLENADAEPRTYSPTTWGRPTIVPPSFTVPPTRRLPS